MDGPKDYYAKWSKSNREQIYRYREHFGGSHMGGVLGGMGEKGEGTKKYKLVITK